MAKRKPNWGEDQEISIRWAVTARIVESRDSNQMGFPKHGRMAPGEAPLKRVEGVAPGPTTETRFAGSVSRHPSPI